MNNDIYQRYTGKNNENVLGNLRYLIGQRQNQANRYSDTTHPLL